jgi:hypothetical protein
MEFRHLWDLQVSYHLCAKSPVCKVIPILQGCREDQIKYCQRSPQVQDLGQRNH